MASQESSAPSFTGWTRLIPPIVGSTVIVAVAVPIAYGAYGGDAFRAFGIGLAIWLMAIGGGIRAYGNRAPSAALASALVFAAALGLALALVGTLIGAAVPLIAALLGTRAIAGLVQSLSTVAATAFQGVFALLGFFLLALLIRFGPVRAYRLVSEWNTRWIDRSLEAASGPRAYPLWLLIALVVLTNSPAPTPSWELFWYGWAYIACIAVLLVASAALLQRIAPALDDLAGVWPYFLTMGRTLLGYALVYCVLVAWFAAAFASLYRLNPSSFAPPAPSRSFWEFLYFSVMTFPPLGYSDLRPAMPATEALVAAESIVGVVMTVVVFAAVTAYLGPRFKLIDEWRQEAARKADASANLATLERLAPVRGALARVAAEQTSARIAALTGAATALIELADAPAIAPQPTAATPDDNAADASTAIDAR